MEIIRTSTLPSTPWKNGGGITREIKREPERGTFRWRVSVAQIDSSGPFSNFQGYRRTMVLLRGAGLRLTHPDGEGVELSRVGDLVHFDGARTTDCQLKAGTCTDLNLMVADSAGEVRAWVAGIEEPLPLAGPRCTRLVFPVRGEVCLHSAHGSTSVLQEWDLAVLSPGVSASIQTATTNVSPPPLVFFALLDQGT